MAADRLELLLERWRDAGLISAGQAGSIRAFEERRQDAQPLQEAQPLQDAQPRQDEQPRQEAQARAEVPPPPSAPPIAAAAVPAHGATSPAGRRPPPPVSPITAARWSPAELRMGLDVRTLGAVVAGLALLALLGNIFAVWTDLFVGPGSRVGSELEDVIHLVASVLGLVGGLRMARGLAAGRSLVYWSLGINLAATIVLGHDRLAQPFTIVTLITWVALLLLTWRARPGWVAGGRTP